MPNDPEKDSSRQGPKPLPKPSPSASVLLISPSNQILLLRRVQKSTTFAAAHVFPGGHIDPEDGPLPSQEDVRIHEDSLAYRTGAIRETFEESGILLAREEQNPSQLLRLDDADRDVGRKAVHKKDIKFQDWIKQHRGIPDIDSLLPFTRWLTPAGLLRRFSTQMYLYFLPLAHPDMPQTLHIPTPDGGIEHTEARFLYAAEWLSLSQAGSITLFPPQFFLLHLISHFLKPPSSSSPPSQPQSSEALQSQREALLDFAKTSDPPWSEKCISPRPLKKDSVKVTMDMSDPGPELRETDRRGDTERVIFAQHRANGKPMYMEVGWRRDVDGEGMLDEAGMSHAQMRKVTDKEFERALRGEKL